MHPIDPESTHHRLHRVGVGRSSEHDCRAAEFLESVGWILGLAVDIVVRAQFERRVPFVGAT